MNKTIVGLLCVSLLGLAACTSVPVGSRKVVASFPGGSIPSWAKAPYFEKDKKMFYRGIVSDRLDMALGIREAKAEAEKELVEQIKQKIRVEFGSAMVGNNVTDRGGSNVRSAIVKVSENIDVSGIRLEDTYYEQQEEKLEDGVKYAYNCYALVSISNADYAEARARVYESAISALRAAQDAKAEIVLEKAWANLNKPAAAPSATATKQE